MKDITEQLKEIFQDRLKQNEPLAKHLNFRIGGPARWFVEVKTIDELKGAIDAAKAGEVEYFVLGGGSNTLASDEGFDGLVIKIAMREHEIEGDLVTVDAGVISASLARATATAGLAGFEWAISLPGTIGGAVRGNAGCFGGEVKDTLQSADVLCDGEIVTLSSADLQFGYRESVIKHSEDIILRATFKLIPGNAEELKQKLDDTLAKRKADQPLHAGSAGCIFKNYEVKDEVEMANIEKEINVPDVMVQAHRISAGWVVDQLDMKGEQIGDAMISNEHGNFIINQGKATASDVIQLISLVKTRARKRYGIQLQEEVRYLGF
jgi:UDP-N-acetylmuramate dehydrogenase